MKRIGAQLQALSDVTDNWDGDGAPAPSRSDIATAVQFWSSVEPVAGECQPSVGPATDGGVVFEWDLNGDRSLYCYARADGVVVAGFDSDREYVDLKLPAGSAGLLAGMLLTAPSWS